MQITETEQTQFKLAAETASITKELATSFFKSTLRLNFDKIRTVKEKKKKIKKLRKFKFFPLKSTVQTVSKFLGKIS